MEHTGEWEDSIKHTVSIGIASLVDDDPDLESMLIRADKALYRAKDEGRDRVCTYGGTDDI